MKKNFSLFRVQRARDEEILPSSWVGDYIINHHNEIMKLVNDPFVPCKPSYSFHKPLGMYKNPIK